MSKRTHKLRFQVRYYRWVTTTQRTSRAPDAYGGSKVLDNLVRNAAGRCAIENYRRAEIFDRNLGGKRVRILNRTATGITITNCEDQS